MPLPPFLVPQKSQILILATARSISTPQIQFAANLIQNKWQFTTHIDTQTIDNQHNQFSGTVQQRLQSLQNAIDNPHLNALVIARGGYGTAQLLEQLNFEQFKKYPKWIIGYSDITALLNHTYQHTHMASLHGSMPVNFETNTPECLQVMYNTLIGKKLIYNNLPHHPLNINGTATGTLIGGNLSVLYSLIGSNSAVNLKNKILFLEDIDEYLYHLDRMLLNLHRSQKLKNLAGLIVGSFTNIKDNPIPFGTDAYNIIYQYVKAYNYPVYFGFEAGHIPNNNPLIIGKKATLCVNTQKTFLRY